MPYRTAHTVTLLCQTVQQHLVIVPIINAVNSGHSSAEERSGTLEKVRAVSSPWRRDARAVLQAFTPIRGLKAKILPYVLLGSAFQRKIEKL